MGLGSVEITVELGQKRQREIDGTHASEPGGHDHEHASGWLEQPAQLDCRGGCAGHRTGEGQERHRHEPGGVAWQSVEPAVDDGSDVRLRLVEVTGLAAQPCQRAAPRDDARVPVDEISHRTVELGQASLFEAGDEQRDPVGNERIGRLSDLAQVEGGGGERLGFVESSPQQRQHGCVHGHLPEVARLAHPIGERDQLRHLLFRFADSTECEQVEHAVVTAGELGLVVSERLADGDDLLGDCQLLGDGGRVAKHPVSAAEHGGQRGSLTGGAGHGDGRDTELVAAAVVGEALLHGQAGGDLGSERRGSARQGGECLVEQRSDRGVRSVGGGDTGEQQRAGGEQVGTTDSPGKDGGLVHPRSSAGEITGAGDGVGGDEEQLGPLPECCTGCFGGEQRMIDLHHRLLERDGAEVRFAGRPAGGHGELGSAGGQALERMVGKRVDVGGTAPGSHRLRDAPVERGPSQARQRAVQRLSHQRVGERARPWCAAVGDQPSAAGGVEVLDELIEGLPGHCRHQVGAELASEHRRHLEGGLHAVREPAQPPSDQVVDPIGDAKAGHGCRSVARIAGHSPPVFIEQVEEHLFHEERVSLGLGVDRCREPVRQVFTGVGADQRGDVAFVQPGEVDPLGQAVTSQLPQQVAEG